MKLINQLKRFSIPVRVLIVGIPAAFVVLMAVFFVSTRTRHVFTVYADGDYISSRLVEQFTQDTGIRVRLVTGGRTPTADSLADSENNTADLDKELTDALEQQGDDSAPAQNADADQAQAPKTLLQLLQEPRDEVIAKARERAEQKGDESGLDMEDIEYPPAEYDVLLTDGATIGKLREHELLMPLTYAKVTNLKNISADYRNLSYDPTGEYSITTMWEYVGLLVNTNLVQTQLTSWDVLWDEHYAGQVAMPDHMEDALAVTLLAMGENPASTDPVRLNAALDKLEQQRSLVASYSNRDAYTLMQGDKTALYPCWSGDALSMMRENSALVYLLPPGGTYRTTFGYAVSADSRYSEEAMTFINYMCSADALARNAVYSNYASTSIAAVNKLDESWGANPVIYPDVSVLAQTPLLTPLSGDTYQLCALRWSAITAPQETDPADQGDASASASGSASQAQQAPEDASAPESSADEAADKDADKKAAADKSDDKKVADKKADKYAQSEKTEKKQAEKGEKEKAASSSEDTKKSEREG